MNKLTWRSWAIAVRQPVAIRKRFFESWNGPDTSDTSRPELPDTSRMNEKELFLYKLYRTERTTPEKRGLDLLKTPRWNKGMAFGLYERQYLGIHGLLPPAFMTQDQQAYRIICKLREQPNDLARYIQLDSLHDRNEKLFYRVVCSHVRELMPIIYTPTVGLACQNFGYIYRHPKGVYITINDNSISKIHHILNNWPVNEVKAIVVTDGERILGLGDLGAYGIGIPVGKLQLYVALAGVQPKWCLPVVIDVGTDNEALLQDPFYIGLRRPRVRGSDYDRLIDNFLMACTKKFGQRTLIQFEDFAIQNAYRLLDKYKNRYTVFNDDIQGTAGVVLAGLLSCSHITGRNLSDEKLIFFGAGTAALGIAELCVLEMCNEGLARTEACGRIYMMDIDGLVTKRRTNLGEHKQQFAKDMEPCSSLLQLIEKIRPTGIIGVSTVRGAFTEEVLRKMTEINESPIVFALSNPTTKSECTAEEAFRYTKGKVLFASGSPFKDIELDGRIFKPGQGNNAYIFPGVGLGIVLFELRKVPDELFLIAAKRVARSVTVQDIKSGRIYPNINSIREISVKIAIDIAEYSYENGLADLHPKPEDIEKYVRAHVYSTSYDEFINTTYQWPNNDMKHGFPVPVNIVDDNNVI